MLKSKEFLYNDEYMYFTFNTIHSSQYNLIITSELGDFKIHSSRDDNVDFLQPANQNGQYKLGVTRPQHQFPLKLLAKNLTRKEIRDMAKWLRVGTQGCLSFDYARDWQYDVVVNEMQEPVLYPMLQDKFMVEFSVTFVTVGESVAHNQYDTYMSFNVSEIDDQDWIYSDIVGLDIPVPGCAIRKFSAGNDGIVLKLRVHFLGNVKTSIDFSAIADAENTANTMQVEFKTADRIFESLLYKAKLILPESAQAHNYILQYKSAFNSFLINNELAEQLILNGQLLGKENDADSEFSHFVYSPSGFFMKSPGECMDITNYTAEQLEALISTPYNFFIYQQAQLKESNLTYYITNTYADTSHDGTMFYRPDQFSMQPNYKYYFGFYKDIDIRIDNYDQLNITIRQYSDMI